MVLYHKTGETDLTLAMLSPSVTFITFSFSSSNQTHAELKKNNKKKNCCQPKNSSYYFYYFIFFLLLPFLHLLPLPVQV